MNNIKIRQRHTFGLPLETSKANLPTVMGEKNPQKLEWFHISMLQCKKYKIFQKGSKTVKQVEKEHANSEKVKNG